MPRQEGNINTLLFITLSNIGDAVLTTPALVLLHQLFPAAAIDIVGDQRSVALFKNCPYRRHVYLKHKHRLLRGSIDLIWRLRRNRYDLIVDLRTGILPSALRGRLKYTHRQGKTATHAVEQHVSVICELTGDRAIPGTQIWLAEQQQQFARQQLSPLTGRALLAIGPGANWERKIWPWRRYAELGTRLADACSGLVLLGSRQDKGLGDSIRATVSLPCINLCGRTTLLEAAAVLERCGLFIGNDSGLGHLASAVGTPTFTLFGPGQPQRYHPWGDKAAWYVDPQADIGRIEAGLIEQKVRAHLAALGLWG